MSIINRNLSDASSLAVATNNLISLRGTKDVSDSLRRLDRLIEKGTGARQFQLANSLDFKLSTRQKESLYANRLLLLLQANRLDQVYYELLFSFFKVNYDDASFMHFNCQLEAWWFEIYLYFMVGYGHLIHVERARHKSKAPKIYVKL